MHEEHYQIIQTKSMRCNEFATYTMDNIIGRNEKVAGKNRGVNIDNTKLASLAASVNYN